MVVRAMPKDSSTIVASGGSVSVQTVFTHPPYLKDGRDGELAMVESGNVLFICKYSSG